MAKQIPIADLQRVQEKSLEEYWLKHYMGESLCSLCGNSGIIDTRQSARRSAGRLNYCICPNGRAMRNDPKQYPLAVKNTIIINGMKFEFSQPTIYYDDLVQLAHGMRSNLYTITYSTKGGGPYGSLRVDDGVEVVENMYFCVVNTSNA